MGIFWANRLMLSVAALVLSAAGAATAVAQTNTASIPTVNPATTFSVAQPVQDPGVIDFENIEGPQLGAGIALSDQYVKSHGVRFGRGASVHFCARVIDDVKASLCSYPRAASGRRVAAHDVRSGGPAMVIDFLKAVSMVTMRINPTGAAEGEVFVAELRGFDTAGAQRAQADIRFNWSEDAFTWPTSATLEGRRAQLARVTVLLRRVAQNNQPVRFLIDDLSLQYAPENPVSPVAAAIAEQKGPPRVADAVVVQLEEVGAAQAALRVYPAAVRKRTVIDWDGVEAALNVQQEMALAAAAYSGERFVAAAELPLLLPTVAEPGSTVIVGNRDSYNAYFKVDGVAYSLYGSRLLTVIDKNGDAPGVNDAVTFAGTEEALTASFAVYGAAYALTRHCADESVTADPACHNRDALAAITGDLVVVVGDAGRARP